MIRRPAPWLVLSVLATILLLCGCAAAALGSVPVPFATVLRTVFGPLVPGRGPTPEEHSILLLIRLPRAVGAAFVGAALSGAGVLLQGMLRNPLADPYVVGTSGGAALGAILGMLFGGAFSFVGFGAVPIGAFLGGMASTLLVYRLASVGGRLPMVSVLLAGFAVSTLLGYLMSLLLILSDRFQFQLPRVYGWLLGGVNVTGWSQLLVVGPIVVLALAYSQTLCRPLNALSLGEEGALRLGVPVDLTKRQVITLGAVLTGCAVAISGLVGFVGLVVPHIVRLICGPDHRLLLPAAALGGATFLVLADLVSRTVVSPVELPVGLVTAFLGGPFFLWLLRRTRREYQW